MTLTNTNIVNVVELILYLPLIPLTLYLGWRHGEHGFLGYFYLHVCCVIHAVADIVSLVTTSQQNPTSVASVVLSSVGLSPLLLAIAGFLHETHLLLHYNTAYQDDERANKNFSRKLWLIQWLLHVVVVVAIVLFIIGGVNLYSGDNPVQASNLRKAGVVILLLGWLTLLVYAVYLVKRSSSRLHVAFVKAASGILVAAILAGARVVYTLVYAFDTLNSSIGDLALQIVLVFLVSLLAVYALIVVSFVSLPLLKHKTRETRRQPGSRSPDVAYVPVTHKSFHS